MISIIIPTLNEEKIIEKTLKSLREFKSDYEIIVSDGKSTDRTVEIAKKYADKVVIYEGVTRQTIAMGRNLGAQVAKGEYLVFIDADVFIPEINFFFEKMLDFFKSNSRLVGATVFLKVFPKMATTSDKFFSWLSNYSVYFYNNIVHFGASYGEFQMVKNDVFKKIGGYNEKLVVTEDNEFFRRLNKTGEIRVEKKLTIFHTGRRAHKIGWSKLLISWWINLFYVMIFGRSYYSEWKEIR
jgi:glycosyltransferase involved in cell wall biosynthesis